jgi:hypothetical protein
MGFSASLKLINALNSPETKERKYDFNENEIAALVLLVSIGSGVIPGPVDSAFAGNIEMNRYADSDKEESHYGTGHNPPVNPNRPRIYVLHLT